jgi:hypothetical protein
MASGDRYSDWAVPDGMRENSAIKNSAIETDVR